MKINSIFTSLEGECFSSGKPTLFIRTQGCNFKCPFCDTKESWDETTGINYSVDELICKIQNSINSGIYRISFTGGNPLLQLDEIDEIVLEIKNANEDVFSKHNIEFNLEHPGINFNAKFNESDCYGIINESAECIRELSNFSTINLDIKLPIAVGKVTAGCLVEEIVDYVKRIYEGKLSSNVYIKFLVDDTCDQVLIKILHMLSMYDTNIPNPMFISPIIKDHEAFYLTAYSKYSKYIIENANKLDIRLNVQTHKLINID